MMYALMGLAGLRHCEMAGLRWRWRNYDPTREPLGKLIVARSYNYATTKSKRPREVPVHATLAAMLEAWRTNGCRTILGREPEPDDLLVPSRESAMRGRHHSRNKLLEDLERLGLRSRRGHDLRRTFITLARADGARADLLEMVTHAPRGNIINIYTSMPWENLCAEVAKLRIALPRDAEVIPLRRAVGGEASGRSGEVATVVATFLETTSDPRLSLAKSNPKMVEAPGVEGRGEGSGFDGLRRVSGGDGLDSAELAGGGESASEVSGGFVEVRCSGVADRGGEGALALGRGDGRDASDISRAAADGAHEGGHEAKFLRARLVALEHVLEAAAALLEVGDMSGALNLIRGCRRPS